MNIEGSVALVTGANRGFGAALTAALLERGAAKVYAGARDPATVTPQERVVPIRLDVTSATDISAVPENCGDLTILINNAGVGSGSTSRADDVAGAAREVFETNLFGPMALSQACAPMLASNGGGAIVNVQSVLAWVATPSIDVYCASKAAGWSFTNALRVQLARQGTQVVGLYVGYMDTGMANGVDAPKADPTVVANQTLDGIEAGAHEVLGDDFTRVVRDSLSREISSLYPNLP